MKWFLLLIFLMPVNSSAQKCSKYVYDGDPYKYIKLYGNKRFEYHPGYRSVGWVGKDVKGKYEIRDSYLFIYGNKQPKGQPLEHWERFNHAIAPDSFRITIFNTERNVTVVKINSDFHIGLATINEQDTIVSIHRLKKPVEKMVLYTYDNVFPPIIVHDNKANDFFIRTHRPVKRNNFLYMHGERFKIANDTLFLMSQDFEGGMVKFVKTSCK